MRLYVIATAMVIGACGSKQPAPRPAAELPAPTSGLRPVSDFAAIADRSERSRALFLEASRVLLHPRCVNCHPDGDTPHQGMEMALHDPPVVRGPKDMGVPGN